MLVEIPLAKVQFPETERFTENDALLYCRMLRKYRLRVSVFALAERFRWTVEEIRVFLAREG